MKNGYVSLKDYELWSVEPVATDLRKYEYPIVEGFEQKLNQKTRKKKKRGMGIDCLREPIVDSKAREEVECQLYDPSSPYLYQFSSLFAKYPFGSDYQIVDPEEYGKNYLDYYSFIDENTKVKYSH